MKDALISFYQTVAPAAIALGIAGFAATFAFNNVIAHFRANLYESEAYAAVAKRLQSIDGTLDAIRPLRVLVWLTTALRFASPAMVMYAAAVPKTYVWTAVAGLAVFLAWAIILVLWLASIRQHQKYEVELTSRKLNERRDTIKIDSGLGTT